MFKKPYRKSLARRTSKAPIMMSDNVNDRDDDDGEQQSDRSQDSDDGAPYHNAGVNVNGLLKKILAKQQKRNSTVID